MAGYSAAGWNVAGWDVAGWIGADDSSNGNKVLSFYGGMSGDRCAGPNCYHKGLVSKSAMTRGTEKSLEDGIRRLSVSKQTQ